MSEQHKEWETVFSSKMRTLLRMPVPGGWLYLSEGLEHSMAFVPRPPPPPGSVPSVRFTGGDYAPTPLGGQGGLGTRMGGGPISAESRALGITAKHLRTVQASRQEEMKEFLALVDVFYLIVRADTPEECWDAANGQKVEKMRQQLNEKYKFITKESENANERP